jgi:CRP/FNR family transcriptional regulator, anaerobic regulatory protein
MPDRSKKIIFAYMNKAAAEKLLAVFPILQSLPSAMQIQVMDEAECSIVPTGKILFDIGSPCLVYPLLLDGSIRVISISEQGRELLLYRVLPGELCIISSSCMLGNSAYPVVGISESELSLVTLSPALFNTLLTQELFRVFIFSIFSERISGLMQLIEAVAFLRLDRRLAALLSTKGLEIHTTHQELADELGSIRELISRLLRRFEDRGIVALHRERIQIVDIEALQSISKVGI